MVLAPKNKKDFNFSPDPNPDIQPGWPEQDEGSECSALKIGSAPFKRGGEAFLLLHQTLFLIWVGSLLHILSLKGGGGWYARGGTY